MRPAWVADYVSSSAITHQFDVPVAEERFRAMVGVPMQADGRFVGVLYAALRNRTRFGDTVVGALQRVADEGAERIYVASRVQQRTDAAVAAERGRIAAGLHDSVGAMLFSTGAELRALREDPAASPQLVQRLRGIEARVAQTASLFRESLAALDEREPDVELSASLMADCRSFESRTGVHARCVAVTALPSLPEETVAALVSLGREALVNVEKHAQARSVMVSVAAVEAGVTLAVADDGVGACRADHPAADGESAGGDAAGPWSSGMGLRVAQQRLARLGGSLSVVNNEDGGLTVRAQVPTR